MHLKIPSAKRQPFYPGGDELTTLIEMEGWSSLLSLAEAGSCDVDSFIITVATEHDDIIKWKHFPRYWPFVRGIHRSRWIPCTKASNAELCCFFYLHPNKRLSKQWWGWWFETPLCPLWRHRNEFVISTAINNFLHDWAVSLMTFVFQWMSKVPWIYMIFLIYRNALVLPLQIASGYHHQDIHIWIIYINTDDFEVRVVKKDWHLQGRKCHNITPQSVCDIVSEHWPRFYKNWPVR